MPQQLPLVARPHYCDREFRRKRGAGVAVPVSARQWAGKVIPGTARAVGDENYRLVVDRLHGEIYSDGFAVRDTHCYPGPCSVGRTAAGEVPDGSAAELIPDRDRPTPGAQDQPAARHRRRWPHAGVAEGPARTSRPPGKVSRWGKRSGPG